MTTETETKPKKQNEETEVSPTSGLGGIYLNFRDDKRIGLTFTNYRTIRYKNPKYNSDGDGDSQEFIDAWTCDVMMWDKKEPNPDQKLQISHTDFREKINDLLQVEKDAPLNRYGIYTITAKITGKGGKNNNKILYDVDDFQTLSEGTKED